MDALLPLAVLALSGVFAATGAVLLAGFFPLRREAGALRYLPLAAALALALFFCLAIGYGFSALSWQAAGIALGLALLGGPLLFQALPPALADSWGSVITLLMISLLGCLAFAVFFTQSQ